MFMKEHNQPLDFTKESLERTMNTMTHADAMRLLGMAKGIRQLEPLLKKLGHNFGVDVTPGIKTARAASLIWTQLPTVK